MEVRFFAILYSVVVVVGIRTALRGVTESLQTIFSKCYSINTSEKFCFDMVNI